MPKPFCLLICIMTLLSNGLLQAATAASSDSVYLDAANLPEDVRKFILPGTKPLALEIADLNRDNLNDYILVLEKPEVEEEQRPLLILLRMADGTLKLAKRNNKALYCSTCGGVMGDPFQGISAGKGTFTISHYGGSGWRWSVETKFNYSRRDKTWQLVQVINTSFHAGDPENSTTKTHTPPKDFGKIDIADFDPEHYLKKR